jgi:hypothetical protein
MAQKFDYAKMKPIWYFVGLILVSMGAVINVTGLYDLFSKTGADKVLGQLHTNIWWGELMVVVGAAFILFNRKPKPSAAKRAPKTGKRNA